MQALLSTPIFDQTSEIGNAQGTVAKRHMLATIIAAILIYALAIILLTAADRWEALYNFAIAKLRGPQTQVNELYHKTRHRIRILH